MCKEEIDQLIRKKPFEPIEIRLVDGRKYRFTSPEQLFVSRSMIHTLDKNGDAEFISLIMIASITLRNGRKRKKA